MEIKYTPTPWLMQDRPGWGNGDWNKPQIYALGREAPIAVVHHSRLYGAQDFDDEALSARLQRADNARALEKRQALANADFIVRACNAHEELLQTGRKLLAVLLEYKALSDERCHGELVNFGAALAKAEGK